MPFRMLGELRVVDGDVDVPIRGAKQRQLLLLLLVRTRETVHAERLADELWGDDQPSGGANALQALVSKLRRALGPLSGALVTSGGGYRLDAEDEEIDARCFEMAAQQGREALAAGALDEAAAALSEALAWWRGPALEGADEDGVLFREAARLEELRWGVLEDRIDADLQTGADAQLVPELEQLVGDAPLRERLHGFLMLALYRAGRQAEALRAYQHAREVLGEELGLDPGPELQALEAAILAHDPALDAVRRAPALPARRRSNLTPALSTFVGRHADLATLRELVEGHRLVTIVGPGGAGKTRLAHELALAVTDKDTFLVELAPLGDPQAVVEVVAAAIGAPAGLRDGETGPARSSRERVVEQLGDRETLLVVDNCEHLIGEAATVVEHLLARCPQLRVIATSREALSVGGETIWPVPPLPLADALDLFADRAAATGGVSAAAADAESVEELCTRLDGLPLAIELAAARVRTIPVQQLSERLDDRFRLLTGGARTALPRQQTLRAVVEWSYDLLFEDERRVFEHLSVFAGGCTLDAAEAVCAGDSIAPEDIADLLGRLVDKSLVVVDHSSGAARFDLLQTLALYGRERLATSEGAHEARDRHAAHYAELCERGAAAFRGTHQAAWLAELAGELDNVRAALAWTAGRGDADGALRLVGGAGWAWWLTGRGDEDRRWFDTALGCPGPFDPAIRGVALAWGGAVGANAGTGMAEAMERGEEAVALLLEHSDDRLSAGDAMVLLAGTHLRMGHRDRTLELYDDAVAWCDEHDDPWSRAVGFSARGRACALRGQVDDAERHYETSVAHFEALGVEWALASVSSDIAVLAEIRGDIDKAIATTERARVAAARLDLPLAECQLLARLGNLALTQGDVAQAEHYHDAAVSVAEAAGSHVSAGVALNGRAMARRMAGRLDDAADAATQALAIYRAYGYTTGEALSLSSLGLIAELQGDLPRAHQVHLEGLAVARRMEDERSIALALEGLAGVALASGEASNAATLLGAAAALREAAGGGAAGPASDVDRITDATIGALGEAAFQASFNAGRRTSVDALPC